MGTATVVRREEADLIEERENLLARVGMDEQDLESRANDYSLSEEEENAWRRIKAINWLLND